MVSDRGYFFVVSKNHLFQHKRNTSYARQIARGEIGAYSSLPALTEKVTVRCGNSGEQHSYKATEILRNVIEIPAGFVPHPRFR